MENATCQRTPSLCPHPAEGRGYGTAELFGSVPSSVSHSASRHALGEHGSLTWWEASLKTTAHTHPSLHWTPIILIVCTTQLALYYILSCSLIASTTQFSTLLHSVRFCNSVMYFCLVFPHRLRVPGCQGPCLVLLWGFPQPRTLFQEQQSGPLTNAGWFIGWWGGGCLGDWLIFWWALSQHLSYLEPGGENREDAGLQNMAPWSFQPPSFSSTCLITEKVISFLST